MNICWLAVLLLAGCASAPPRGEATPQRLLADMKAACGGAAWDRVKAWHERSRADVPGMPPIENDVWHDMRTLKSAMTSMANGQTVRKSGYNGKIAWQSGPGGQLRIVDDPAELRKQRRDAYLSSFGWFFPGRFPANFTIRGMADHRGATYRVLVVAPQDAEPFELWIDPRTQLVSRIVAGDEYAELSDYRSFGGVCTATTGRQGGGKSGGEIILHVIDVRVDETPALSMFEPPAPKS